MIALRLNDLRQHSDILRLRSGGSLMVRFVEPRDAESLQGYFRSLSVRSRYNRFLGAMSELPRTQLDHFIHVGEDDRFSVVATMLVDGIETVVGEARYAFEPDTASFEFGLSIDDRWQGQGIGQALLKNLECRAAAFGAKRLFGDTLRSNAAMIGLARKSGFAFLPSPGDWKLVRFEKHIDVAPQEIPCASWRLAAVNNRHVMARRKRAFAHPLAPPEHRLALFNKSLHRLAVIRRHRGADQALGLMVARGSKIEQQGFVEIILHVT
jgi:GNAT superfamily N-acetyltransferase